MRKCICYSLDGLGVSRGAYMNSQCAEAELHRLQNLTGNNCWIEEEPPQKWQIHILGQLSYGDADTRDELVRALEKAGWTYDEAEDFWTFGGRLAQIVPVRTPLELRDLPGLKEAEEKQRAKILVSVEAE